MTKATLRLALLQRRASISPAAAQHAARGALQALIKSALLEKVRCVGGYIPMRHELDVLPILHYCAQKASIALPVMMSGAIKGFASWSVDQEVTKGPMGSCEPHPPHCLVQPDFVLIPALGVDAQGNRLGYGKGCYDRWLGQQEKRPVCVAAVYPFQILTNIGVESHDQPVDFILTPETCIRVMNRYY